MAQTWGRGLSFLGGGKDGIVAGAGSGFAVGAEAAISSRC